jgi:uncharacterized membrane protein YuzA (DUF378 family)
MKLLKTIAIIILIIGGLNWGLVGLSNFNLVAEIFKAIPVISRVIYVLIGLSAVYVIVAYKSICK